MLKGLDKKEIATISLLALLALFLRLLNLGGMSIWGDEAFSIMVAKKSAPEIVKYITSPQVVEVHPPFYYLLLHCWISLFGHGYVAARLLSAICGVLSVLLLYILGKKIANRWIGMLAGIFLCISPFHTWYSQEARMYSICAMLCLAAAIFYFMAVKSARYCHYLAYLLFAIAAIYTHYFAILFIVSLFLYSFWHSRRQQAIRISLVFHSLALCSILPWHGALYGHLSKLREPIAFAPEVSIPKVMVVLVLKFLGYGNSDFYGRFPWLYVLAVLWLAGSIALGIKQASLKNRSALVFSLSAVALPYLVVSVAMGTGLVIYRSHPMVIFLPYFYLFISTLIYHFSGKYARYIAISAFVIINLFVLFMFNLGGYTKPRVQDAYALIIETYQTGDVVAKVPEVLPGVGSYSYLSWKYHKPTGIELHDITGNDVDELLARLTGLLQEHENLFLVVPYTSYNADEMEVLLDKLRNEAKMLYRKRLSSRLKDFDIIVFKFKVK